MKNPSFKLRIGRYTCVPFTRQLHKLAKGSLCQSEAAGQKLAHALLPSAAKEFCAAPLCLGQLKAYDLTKSKMKNKRMMPQQTLSKRFQIINERRQNSLCTVVRR